MTTVRVIIIFFPIIHFVHTHECATYRLGGGKALVRGEICDSTVMIVNI